MPVFRSRLIACFALLALALGCAAPVQSAEKRVALVIGNSAYTHVGPLANPGNDARAIAQVLRSLDFYVIEGEDLGYDDMRGALKQFSNLLGEADLALLFYAGHGLQAYGENYLLPVDTQLETGADIAFETMSLDRILKQMNRLVPTSVVLLDACRNNPFQDTLNRPGYAAFPASQGLAEISAQGGVLIGYATEPGAVALDGDGANSPFTAALLEEIGAVNVEINTMLTRVRARVFETTGGAQRPWTSSSLLNETYLNPDQAAQPASASAEIRRVSTLGALPLVLTKPHYWTAECETRRTNVRLLAQPLHGNVTIQDQMSVIGDFGPGRRLSGEIGGCASRPVVAKVVTYAPREGFQGTDTLTIEIGSPGFTSRRFTYFIQVN
jgi:hypothetical protein